MIDGTRIVSVWPGTPGRKQQNPRTTRSIGTPAREATPARRIPAYLELIHLRDDTRGPTGLVVVDLASDQPEKAVTHIHGATRSLPKVGARAPGEMVKQGDDIGGQLGIAGEQPDIGV